MRRKRKDWEVAMGVIKGLGGEKYGEIMQQYSIFRNQNKALEEGSHTKKGTGVAGLDPLSSILNQA